MIRETDRGDYPQFPDLNHTVAVFYLLNRLISMMYIMLLVVNGLMDG